MRNPLTLDAMADWAEKQPADGSYDYWDSGGCACALYARHIGMGDTVGGFPEWREAYYGGSTFWWKADDAASDWPWKFGALSSRLRAASTSGRT